MTRVLVIDDCEELREVVRELLQDAGYLVELAEDSRTALSQMQNNRFDVVLCDLVLPLGNPASASESDVGSDSAMVGMHCIHELSRRYPNVPVIAISGELVGSPLSIAHQFGAKGSLSKPFGVAELIDAVEGALNIG
jgi:CheY-like chemotaxis protein